MLGISGGMRVTSHG